jgi:hypothetical protein
MAVTEILQIPDPFKLGQDDFRNQSGDMGLHLEVLRRFAMLALTPPAHRCRQDVN